MLNSIATNNYLSVSVLILGVVFILCLNLDLSVASLMSGHALGKQTSQRRLKSLLTSFHFGFTLMAWLLISSLCLVLYFGLNQLLSQNQLDLTLTVLLLVQGLILIFMNQLKSETTHTWLQPSLRHFLTKRATQTRSAAEAFSLGLSSFLAASFVITLPLLSIALTLLELSNTYLIPTTILISLILGLPLAISRICLRRQGSLMMVLHFITKQRRFFYLIRLYCLILMATLLFLITKI